MAQRGRIDDRRVLQKLDECFRRNDYADAKRLLLYWYSEAQTLGDGKGTLLMLNELMGLCRKLGEREQALAFVDKALEQVKVMALEHTVGAATTYLNGATVYKAFGMADKGIPLFEKARMIYEQQLSPDDDRLGGLYNNMGLALVDVGRFEEADVCYRKALSVMSVVPDKEPEQAITYLNMASAAEAQYGLEAAASMIEDHVQKAMDCLEGCRQRTDGNYAFVCEKCATVFDYYGHFDYAKRLTERYRRIYEGT